ncbi:hypothetical protein GCM10009584_21210 [Ornithinimicrobium humiphilum]|uniref:DUF2218 domain-containing protein n=1 Tax=Ornithinimicrobium humiphilum TaxID=125288 RepID=A0A543KNE5_9MICO|nr:DUF2218 domain-containing protein [Ornithinimicrobium humiphilum]TQM96584.1 hypothetical protein FB476_1453 [Ornithinimicrobium humiphilum]
MTDTTTLDVTRTALVATDTPARWAKQLASHLGRPGKMTVEETDRGPQLAMAFDDQQATCLMDTTAADTLGLHVASSTEEAAERMTRVVGSHLERFGAKVGLTVTWG